MTSDRKDVIGGRPLRDLSATLSGPAIQYRETRAWQARAADGSGR